jgi:AcrR family transcriptional regulator
MARTDTKERIVDATAECFRRQGYAGTGLKQIAASADAAFGSLYHFFPGGKEELGAEVIRWSGRMYMQLFIDIALEVPDVVEAVGRFFNDAAADVEESDFADACPIATVALEVSSTSEPLRQACADVFESWLSSSTAYFAGAGIDRDQSHRLALQMLSLLEGAFIFSRAMRTTEPILVAGEAAVAAVRAALPG